MHEWLKLHMVWCLCRTGVEVIAMASPLCHIDNIQHDFKEWGENQRIMLHDKTSLLNFTTLLKHGSRAPGNKALSFRLPAD